MPSAIMKPDRDEDFYVLWSSVTESPHAWGTRAELLAGISRDEADPDRFTRADAYGTSARWNFENQRIDDPEAPRWLDWNDEREIYQQQGFVPRDKIRALCERLERGAPVDDLLIPFEDEVPK